MSSKVTLQIVASLIDAARGVIYDPHMFIVQAIGVLQYPSLERHERDKH